MGTVDLPQDKRGGGKLAKAIKLRRARSTTRATLQGRLEPEPRTNESCLPHSCCSPHARAGRHLRLQEDIIIGPEVYLEMLAAPRSQRIKRMYSSVGMFHNRGKAEEGVLLCRAIIAMANNLQMNLDSNDYSFNDLRNFIKLLKI